jgi:hypothetical protein
MCSVRRAARRAEVQDLAGMLEAHRVHRSAVEPVAQQCQFVARGRHDTGFTDIGSQPVALAALRGWRRFPGNEMAVLAEVPCAVRLRHQAPPGWHRLGQQSGQGLPACCEPLR